MNAMLKSSFTLNGVPHAILACSTTANQRLQNENKRGAVTSRAGTHCALPLIADAISRVTRAAAWALIMVLAAQPARAQHDFGDAPDGGPTGYPLPFAATGQFPSLLSSDGARTSDITQMTLGPSADLELDADVVNLDADDGPVGVNLVVLGIPPAAALEVIVSAGTGGSFFLNVLIDLNMDGVWGGFASGGEPEWVVQNSIVTLPAGGVTTNIPPPFAFGNGNRLPDGAWMRIALTDSPVPDGWTGTGEFLAGEIEDFVVQMPVINTPDGPKRLCTPVVYIPNPPGSNPIKIPAPAAGDPWIANFGASLRGLPGLCDIGYTLTAGPGIDWIGDPLPVGPVINGVVADVTAVPATQLAFRASGSVLPAQLTYTFSAIDPPSVVSAETIQLGFGDITGIVEFTTEEVMDKTFAAPSNTAQTSQAGFIWRIHQVASPQPNSLLRAELQLAGGRGANVANAEAIGEAIAPGIPGEVPNAPITFEIESVINLGESAGSSLGNFSGDRQMPGIPSSLGGKDNFAVEVLTWLDLPEGEVTMGVNSDDGFRLSIGGTGLMDRFKTKVGEFNGGRLSADTTFTFTVRQAGLYPARLLYEEGSGGAGIEWFSVKPNGSKVLVNDVVNGGIRAFRAITRPSSAVAVQASPEPGAQSVPPNAIIAVDLQEGAIQIHPSSIRLMLDGVETAPQVTKTGSVIRVSFRPPNIFTPGSEHNVSLAYVERVAVVRNWGFAVQSRNPTVPWMRPAFVSNPFWDINSNGTPDLIEIELEAVPDRNRNLIPDVAEYSSVIQVLYPAVGVGVNKLTGDPTFPLGLNFLQAQDGLDMPDRPLFDSGYRAEGVFIPRRTGNHRFHIASDDQSEFWLSTDADPANKVLIAAEPQWTNYREFTGNAGGRRPALSNNTWPNASDGICLQAGQLYYLDFLQKQAGGGNHFSISVQEPGGPPVVNGLAQAPIGAGLVFPHMTPPSLYSIDLEIGDEDKITIPFDENQPDVIRVPEHRSITLIPFVAGSAPMEWTLTVNGVTDSTGVYPFSSDIQLGAAPTNLFLTINVSNLMGGQSRTLSIEADEDVEPPTLSRVYASSIGHGELKRIVISFAERIQNADATNFEVRTADGLSIEIVAVETSFNYAFLRVPSSTELTGATIVLRGIKDLAGNELPPAKFDVTGFRDLNLYPIGLPAPTSPPLFDNGESIEITAGGADVWFNSDQCIFYSTSTTGDFDVQVRVDDLTATHPNAKGGIMFRQSTDANSPIIFNCQMPSGRVLDGLFSGHGNNEIETGVRRTTAGQTESWGTMFPPPASFPNRWIRLQRTGSLFRAFHSPNGMDWTQHGQTTLNISTNGWLGLFAVSHNVNYVTTARFSHFGPVQPTPVTIDIEKLRETGVVSWSPQAGQAYLADNVTGPFQPLAKKQPVALKPTKGKRFFQVGPAKDGKGAISGRLTDDNGNSLSNVFVRVGEGHTQLTGADGRFTFGRVAEGVNELHITKELVDENGRTNKLNLTFNIPVAPNVNVPVNLKIACTNGPVPQPNCPCTPWAMVGAGNVNGIQTVVAVGGKIGVCDEESRVHLGRPSSTDLLGCEEVIVGMWLCPLRPEVTHTYSPAPNGIWTVTAEVCGLAVQTSVEIP